MTHIEVLPNTSTTSSTPGWAYVPDTGYDPSKAAIIPTGARKRTNRAGQLTTPGGVGNTSGGAARDELSVREQNKINAYLELLQKDSLKDVHIVLHNKARDLGSRGLRGKMTPGVRKIMTSQKTFANHLADEEAALANQQQQHHHHHHHADQQAQGSSSSSSAAQRQHRGRQHSTPANIRPDTAMELDATNDHTAASVQQQPSQKQTAGHGNDISAAGADHEDDTRLLLQQEDVFFFNHDPGLPRAPTEQEIEALLAAPALSYTAARAAPSASSAPPRRFCTMCGYFGAIRCPKCSARVCGLECKLAHDEGKCLKF